MSFCKQFRQRNWYYCENPKNSEKHEGLNFTLKLSSILILITLFKKTLQVSIKSESQTKGLNFTNGLNDSCALTVMCYNVSLLS